LVLPQKKLLLSAKRALYAIKARPMRFAGVLGRLCSVAVEKYDRSRQVIATVASPNGANLRLANILRCDRPIDLLTTVRTHLNSQKSGPRGMVILLLVLHQTSPQFFRRPIRNPPSVTGG
jgi:hypothetical protein